MSPRIGLNFNQLLSTSIKIVDTEGWEALTISYLAKKLTIQPPSIYNHIKNLDELKNSVALYGISQLYVKLHESVEGKNNEKALFALAFAYLDYARSHPGLYKATLSPSQTPGDEYRLTGNKILNLIYEVLKPYNLTDTELIHAVRGLRSLLHGFVSLEKSDGFGINIPIDESVLFVLKNYVRNLKQDRKK